MKKQDRFDWIEAYIRACPGPVSIINSDFVTAYILTTNPTHIITRYGAPKCAQLARDLAAMHDGFILSKERVNIKEMGSMGFPKWVYSYNLYIY